MDKQKTFYNYELIDYRLYDGDSITSCTISLGFLHYRAKASVRLARIDTPEVRKKDDPLHKEAGLLVTQYVRSLLEQADTVWISSVKSAKHKYGSIIADVFVDTLNINDHLLERRFAKPYEGKKKELWLKKDLQFIIDELNVKTS